MSLLQINPIIKTKKNEKVYCNENYAQELYNKFSGNLIEIPIGGKDLEINQVLKITGVTSIFNHEIYFEVNNLISVPIELDKEKRFFEIHGLTKNAFINWLKSKKGEEEFLNQNNLLLITNGTPEIKGSLFKGYTYKLKEEMISQIKNPTTAYKAKILSKNRGGFMVDVIGITAFLPGGLAAANKITNFDDYVGKTINVMVEDYLANIDTFIMSNKKYINYVLPLKTKNLDLNIKHKGIVTGIIDYGVFVEFNELFTGLLHTSKMDDKIKNKFERGLININDEFECYIKEIEKNYRLILTCFSLEEELKREKELSLKEEDKKVIKINNTYNGKIVNIKNFGVFVKLDSGEVGMIPREFFTREYKINTNIKINIEKINNDKLYFKEVDI